MDAFFAIVPLHILYDLQMIKQNNLKDCDLYYAPLTKNTEEVVEQIRMLGIFKNVYLLPNIVIEFPITLKQIVQIFFRKFKAMRMLKGKKYDTVYYNTDGWLFNSIIYSGLNDKITKNVFVENGILPYITPYDSKEWYLRLFINMNFLTCMDGRFIDERFLFEPSLVSVPQSGEFKKIEKIDCNDEDMKAKLNFIFKYDEALDSFKDKDIIIMEQGPRREPIDMYGLWEKVKGIVDVDRTIVKSHPRQKDSVLRELGFDIYERYVIPWEVLTMNQNMDDKTLFTIFSTSVVNPKLMFDQEPRVILLYKLIGIDYSFFGQGMIDFVNGVGSLYRDKTKFFIPETWDELREYYEKYMK